MIRWERVTRARICGRCGAKIAIDSPALIVQVIAVTRMFLRCPNCADRPLPPEMAATMPAALEPDTTLHDFDDPPPPDFDDAPPPD